MKNLNITISSEAHKRLNIYQAKKNISNKATAVDKLILETLPANE